MSACRLVLRREHKRRVGATLLADRGTTLALAAATLTLALAAAAGMEGTLFRYRTSPGSLQAFMSPAEHAHARYVIYLGGLTDGLLACSYVEELAAEFGLRTQDAVSRVQALEQMGRITGVMDDRGKFIFISRDEMAEVAAFINRKGRVAIAELARKSSDFVKL